MYVKIHNNFFIKLLLFVFLPLGVSSPWLLENEKSLRRGEEYALSWLTSNQLLSTILATVGDLQGVLQKAQEGRMLTGHSQDIHRTHTHTGHSHDTHYTHRTLTLTGHSQDTRHIGHSQDTYRTLTGHT